MPNDFQMLMSARFLFTFAVQMQAIILGWQMYNLTHDPLSLGMIGLVEAIPALGFALFAGHIVDRGRPLIIYRLTVLVSLLSGMVMFLSQYPTTRMSVLGQIIALYISSFLTGTARSFSQPAIFATVPRIVPRNELPKASAWMSSSMQIARIAGPAVGGVIFGWLGVMISAGIVCAILILSLLAVFLIRTTLNAPAKSLQKTSFKNELFLGASFVFRHPILFPALTLDMVSVLFGGVTALLPIYAAEILMIGPKGLGVLRAAPAIGAAIISFWLIRFNLRHRAGSWLFLAVAGFGVCVLIFGLSKNFYLSLIALGLSGAFDSVSMVIRTSAVQLVSPDSLRGRISAVNSIFIGSSNEIGEFESGVAAKLFGPVNAVIIGGVMCLLTVVVMARFFPILRKLNLDELHAGS